MVRARRFAAPHHEGRRYGFPLTASARLAFADPGLQRLLLALMRRPARQPDHVEGGADAAVGIGKALAVDLRHPQQRGAAGRRPPPLDQDIGRAHAPQIVHQRERVVVAHHDAIDVGDRQREAGALQQRADVAQIGERRDARRHPAFAFGFGRGERLPQLGQRIAADHRRQQQPVGLQRAADLRQHAGQIVDELKGERRDDEIERFRLQRQRFAFGIIETNASDGFEATAQRLRASADRPASRYPRRQQICRVTACSRSAISSTTRSSRKVAGPARSARSCRARSSARSNRTGAAFGVGAMPVWYAVHGSLAI